VQAIEQAQKRTVAGRNGNAQLPWELLQGIVDSYLDTREELARLYGTQIGAVLQENEMLKCHNESLVVQRDDALSENGRYCEWGQDEDGVWYSDCSGTWTFSDRGTPIEHRMAYCPFCGGAIRVNVYPEEG